MVRNLDIRKITSRTFGWVQDPSEYWKLKNVVRLFDIDSKLYKRLLEEIIPDLVKEEEVRDRLLEALKVRPLQISYRDLVGKGFSLRKMATCNGIIQAAVPGQQRPYIADWPADNFLRWAHALGFVDYNYENDTFSISEDGLAFSRSEDGELEGRKYNLSKEEKNILIDAMLSYPPAVRILNLLRDGDVLTKFEIAKNLGFIGEDGFTRYPQDILLESLATEEDDARKRALRTDCEGSADKYARMISTWLEKLGLVKKVQKTFMVKCNGLTTEEYISHAYRITGDGIKISKRTKGINKVERTGKRVYWEMLCSAKGSDRDYIRIRRANIINMLMTSTRPLSADRIRERLADIGMIENTKVIMNDIEGIINIGINIETDRNGEYKLFDDIIDFCIPRFMVEELKKSELSILKDELAEELEFVPSEYLGLVDMSFDRTQSRLFESTTMELFKECGFDSLHLGGVRKPDGIASSGEYGIIFDTKAYGKGFNIPIGEADKMQRYVEENIRRDENINNNKWWEKFPSDVNKFRFLFVSGRFIGEFENQLERISGLTGVNGAVINVVNLLKLADKILGGKLTKEEFMKECFNNKEISFK